MGKPDLNGVDFGLLAEPGDYPIGDAGNEAVQPNQSSASKGQNDFVSAFLHGSNGPCRHGVGRHRAAFLPVFLGFVFDGGIKELAVGGAGANQQNLDSVLGEFSANRIAEPVDGKFTGTVFAF